MYEYIVYNILRISGVLILIACLLGLIFNKRFSKGYRTFVINFSLAIIVTALGIIFHKGYKENYISYFIMSASIFSFLNMVLSKNKLIKDVLLSCTIVIALIFLIELFWVYMSMPMYFRDIKNYPFTKFSLLDIDLRGYTYFSFENELNHIVIPISGVSAILFGSILRFAISGVKFIVRKCVKVSK